MFGHPLENNSAIGAEAFEVRMTGWTVLFQACGDAQRIQRRLVKTDRAREVRPARLHQIKSLNPSEACSNKRGPCPVEKPCRDAMVLGRRKKWVKIFRRPFICI